MCIPTISLGLLMPHDATPVSPSLLTLVLPLHVQKPGMGAAAKAVAQVCSVLAIWPDPGADY